MSLARAAACLAFACVALAGCDQGSTLDPPQRLGPPALVSPDGDPQLWLLTKQHERVHGLSSGSSGGRRHHIDLRGFDSRTAKPLWRRRLLSLDELQGGHNAGARILGQDGTTVWLYVGDQPFALAADDGRVLGGADRIVQKNPALRGLLPARLEGYTFDAGLVISTVDGRRHVVRGPDAVAQPYVADPDEFRRIAFMTAQWNGGYRMTDFLVRHGDVGGRWLGLYSEREAADARNDTWGRKLKDASRVLDEGDKVRRALHTATLGRTPANVGGEPRLGEVVAVPGADDFLAGGFLVKPGTREPLVLADPPGPLVVHRSRTDDTGRVLMTRLDATLRPLWSATLPFAELRNRWQLADRLVVYGRASEPPAERGGHAREVEAIAVVELAGGAVHAWQVQRDGMTTGK